MNKEKSNCCDAKIETDKLKMENKRLKEKIKNALEVIRKAGIDDYQIVELVEKLLK